MDFLNSIAGQIVALLGTVFVAVLGYRQWRKQQDLAHYGRFVQQRQTAYETLWAKLEAVHLTIRSSDFHEDTFHSLVRAVNTHLIQVGLHLDRGEKKRVNDYLESLGALGRLLAESTASEAKTQAKTSMHDTAVIPIDVLAEVEGLKVAYDAVEERRQVLIEQFRRVLGAHLVS